MEGHWVPQNTVQRNSVVEDSVPNTNKCICKKKLEPPYFNRSKFIKGILKVDSKQTDTVTNLVLG